MKRIRVITFDVGGTLLFPFPSVGHVYAEVAAMHEIHADAARLQTCFREAWVEARGRLRTHVSEASERDVWRFIVQKTFQDVPHLPHFEELFQELWSTFARTSRWRLHLGVVGTLANLRRRGFELAILSNWDSRLRELLQGFDLMKYFTYCSISSEVGFEKPHREIFSTVERYFDIPGDRILHVGDSEYRDEKGAQLAGWNGLLVTHQEEFPTAPHQIRELPELLNHHLLQI